MQMVVHQFSIVIVVISYMNRSIFWSRAMQMVVQKCSIVIVVISYMDRLIFNLNRLEVVVYYSCTLYNTSQLLLCCFAIIIVCVC